MIAIQSDVIFRGHCHRMIRDKFLWWKLDSNVTISLSWSYVIPNEMFSAFNDTPSRESNANYIRFSFRWLNKQSVTNVFDNAWKQETLDNRTSFPRAQREKNIEPCWQPLVIIQAPVVLAARKSPVFRTRFKFDCKGKSAMPPSIEITNRGSFKFQTRKNSLKIKSGRVSCDKRRNWERIDDRGKMFDQKTTTNLSFARMRHSLEFNLTKSIGWFAARVLLDRPAFVFFDREKVSIGIVRLLNFFGMFEKILSTTTTSRLSFVSWWNEFSAFTFFECSFDPRAVLVELYEILFKFKVRINKSTRR